MLCIFDPLAQSVEHLTFNQGVPGSSPGWVTSEIAVLVGKNGDFFFILSKREQSAKYEIHCSGVFGAE